MQIIFNASPCVRLTTGIGTYAKELIRHLLRVDTRNHYTMFSARSPLPNRWAHFPKLTKNNLSYRSIIAPYSYLNYLWNNLNTLPIEWLTGPADIVHSIDRISPYTKKIKVVTTMLDMSWYYFGPKQEREGGLIYKQVINTLNRSSAIITCSQFSKEEILKKFPFVEDKITVIHLGASNNFRVIDDRRLNNMDDTKYPWKDFILYIGLLDEPRKNVMRIVSAYAMLKKKKRIKEKLILCGKFFRANNNLLRLIKKVNLPDDIIVYTKWLFDQDIPVLYNKAKLVLLPSLYEGFGLPIVESMACGTPVITSNISPMKEIVADAALLVNPENEKELADSIEMILSDITLYNSLVKKGLNRRREFTWEKTALETLKVYELCINK